MVAVWMVKTTVHEVVDVIAMRDDRLYINGKSLVYLPASAGEGSAMPDAGAYVFGREDLTGHVHAVMAIPDRPAMRSFGPLMVPAGEYFVMGDNRDDSKDSRYIGFIRERDISSRVFAVGYSLDPDHHYLPRLDRGLQALH